MVACDLSEVEDKYHFAIKNLLEEEDYVVNDIFSVAVIRVPIDSRIKDSEGHIYENNTGYFGIFPEEITDGSQCKIIDVSFEDLCDCFVSDNLISVKGYTFELI